MWIVAAKLTDGDNKWAVLDVQASESLAIESAEHHAKRRVGVEVGVFVRIADVRSVVDVRTERMVGDMSIGLRRAAT